MPRVVQWPLPGKKCPLCTCYLATNVDFDSHVETHWNKNADGTQWMWADRDPYTRDMLRNVGVMVKDAWKYSLSRDGRVIVRKKWL